MVTTVNNLFQHLLQACDRTPLIQRLIGRHGWSPTQAERATRRYCLFLCVAAVNDHLTLVPTQEIDQVWEEHILLSTADYVRLCEQLCGVLIDHAEEAALQQATDFEDLPTAFERTKTLLLQHAGHAFFGDSLSHLAACGRPGIVQ